MFWDYHDEPKYFKFKTATLSVQKLYVKSYTEGIKKYDAYRNRLPFKYKHVATRYFLYNNDSMIGFIIDDITKRISVYTYLEQAKRKLRLFLKEKSNG